MSTSTSRCGPPKKIRSWVRPGVLDVRASVRRPVSAFTRDDLPTLERPAKAISGPAGCDFGCGKSIHPGGNVATADIQVLQVCDCARGSAAADRNRPSQIGVDQ